jgi:hypothetical protein
VARINLADQVQGGLSPTFGGTAALTQNNEVLPASTKTRALQNLEINSAYSFQIPATSSLNIEALGYVGLGSALEGVIIGANTPAAAITTNTIGTGAAVHLNGAQLPWLNQSQAVTGTLKANGAFNFLNILDQVVLTDNTQWGYGLRVQLTSASPSVGPRVAVGGNMVVNSVGTSGIDDVQAVGVQANSVVNGNLGGTAPDTVNSVGSAWGVLALAALLNGSTNQVSCISAEADVTVATGCSVATKIGVLINNTSLDVVRGSVDDIALCFSKQESTTASWLKGISFGRAQLGSSSWGNWPFQSDSTIIGTSPAGAGIQPAGIGIDFSAVTFSGPALKTGNGQIMMGPMAAPTPTSGVGQFFVASDGSFNYANTHTVTMIATGSASGGLAPPPGTFAPADYGYISWNYDPIMANGGLIIVAGEAYLSLVPVRSGATITNVVLDVNTVGSSLTSGQCFAGLFNSSGALLSATADQSTAWASTGLKTMALTTPQTVTPGLYYVGFFANGTTMPKFEYFSNAVATIGATGSMAVHPRAVLDTTHTGLTTAFPSTATLSASLNTYWAAVS